MTMTLERDDQRRFTFARDIRASATAGEPVADVFAAPANLDELAVPPADHREVEIPMGEFTAREWAIFRQGQRWGYESRQAEVDAAWNAYNAADFDADRYYRAAYDHDNHDCAIHANKGRYQGAATKLLHWVDADQPDSLDP
jgi:hypothetical protein